MSRIVAPPTQTPPGEGVGAGRRLASRALPARGWPKSESFGDRAATIGGENKPLELQSRARVPVSGTRGPFARPLGDARFATPGQAGLPAEFKHINKRRKRNLPGFP